ncbi:MAG: DUF2625 domain-containing protein [Ferruginibacter sp.]
MIKLIITTAFTFFSFLVFAQNNMRPVEELISRNEPGWKILQKWIDSSTNDVVVLPTDTITSKEALFKTQVTTHSPLGSIIYFTGGLLIDHGWIRILGSGKGRLTRSVPDWNKGKSFQEFGDAPGFLLIADDVVGGFFAMNGGKFGKADIGKIYYLSPDRLEWEALDLTYTEFLLFCFNGDLVKFYGEMRWEKWAKQVSKMNADKVYNFSPPLWTKEGKDISKDKRKAIPAAEQYQFNMQARKTLKLDDIEN